METVKVDVQKLQILNDRIAQCLEALNQVRLSVHGLQQAQSGLGGFTPGLGGIAHTSPQMQTPFVSPYGQPFGTPWGAAQPTFPQPFVQPWGQQGVPGISHTPWTPQFGQFGMMSDPFAYARLAQTFPYAFVNVPIY